MPSDDRDARWERFMDWDDPGNFTITRPHQCPHCTYYHAATAGSPTCDAFPAGIPVAILANRFDHHRPYPGDGGIRFVPEDAPQSAPAGGA